MPMRLGIPVLRRSDSKMTIASFGNANTKEIVNDNSSIYRVDSMVFESVEIPRTTPPPAIRVSFATSASRSSYDSRASTWSPNSSLTSLPHQPSLTDEKAPQPKLHPFGINSATLNNSMTTLSSRSDPENTLRPPQKKNTLARTLFFLGFLFPPFWAFGAALIWRKTDYAGTDLTASASCKPRYHHSQPPTFQTQGRYIQRIGQLERENCITQHDNPSMTTLSSNTTVFVHLPYQNNNWAWACLWAFTLSFVALTITLIALYANII